MKVYVKDKNEVPSWKLQQDDKGYYYLEDDDCKTCGNSGLDENENACPDCHGTGWTEAKRNKTFKKIEQLHSKINKENKSKSFKEGADGKEYQDVKWDMGNLTGFNQKDIDTLIGTRLGTDGFGALRQLRQKVANDITSKGINKLDEMYKVEYPISGVVELYYFPKKGTMHLLVRS